MTVNRLLRGEQAASVWRQEAEAEKTRLNRIQGCCFEDNALLCKGDKASEHTYFYSWPPTSVSDPDSLSPDPDPAFEG